MGHLQLLISNGIIKAETQFKVIQLADQQNSPMCLLNSRLSKIETENTENTQ